MLPRGGGVTAPPTDSGGAVDPPLASAHRHTPPLHQGIGWTAEELQKLQADDRDIGQVA